jgi:hypothetical protein
VSERMSFFSHMYSMSIPMHRGVCMCVCVCVCVYLIASCCVSCIFIITNIRSMIPLHWIVSLWM